MLKEDLHFLVTVIRATLIIKRLHSKYNFVHAKTDDETMQLVVDLVMLRTLSNDEICKEIIEMHSVDLREAFK
jgi:hypothetical protein